MAYKRKNQDETEILKEALERFETAEDAEQHLRQKATEDLRFVYEPGQQWEETVKEERGERPCYEFNKLRPIIRQIVNEQRQNRPGLKFRAVDSDADPDTAEVMTGLCRNIFNISDGDTILDFAFEHAVAGGFGAVGVVTEHSSDSSFEQDIKLRGFQNPNMVQFDPQASDWLKRDARFGFVVEEMPIEDFKDEYPDASIVEFQESEGTEFANWFTEDTVRIAEYWCRKPVKKEIAELEGGEVIELTDEIRDEAKQFIVRTRTVNSHRVEMYLITAHEILEGPFEWAGTTIPLVPVYGEYINVEGRVQYAGVARYAKDSQRSYNYHRTTLIEAVALQPKAPWQATPAQMKGFEKIYQNANRRNYSVIPYNPDPNAANVSPSRTQPPAFPTGLGAAAEMDAQDIMDTSGMTARGMGQDESEQSGRAIRALQQKSELTTFAFQDNLNKSLKRIGEILVDLIPRIYDTERVVRILGEDGAEKFETVNMEIIDRETGEPFLVHDLAMGKYDVEVTTGPSYATRRQEVVDWMIQMAQASPEWGRMAYDIIAKNLDLPESDELYKRFRRAMIQQGLVEPNPEDEDEMRIAQGDPKQKAMQEQLQQLDLSTRAAELQKKLAEISETKADTAKTMQDAAAASFGDEKAQLELVEKNFDIIAKALDNAIKRGQVQPRINPVTGFIEEVSPARPDVDPQVHIGTG